RTRVTTGRKAAALANQLIGQLQRRPAAESGLAAEQERLADAEGRRTVLLGKVRSLGFEADRLAARRSDRHGARAAADRQTAAARSTRTARSACCSRSSACGPGSVRCSWSPTPTRSRSSCRRPSRSSSCPAAARPPASSARELPQQCFLHGLTRPEDEQEQRLP